MVLPPEARQKLSIADLENFPEDGRLRELVDGRLVEWDVPTYHHGLLLTFLCAWLHRFVRERRLGEVVTGDTMVKIEDSDFHARGPDLAFYRRGRRPKDINAPATAVIPDFVVEILSPSDRADRVLAKVQDWLDAGVPLLWYVNPETGVVTVYEGSRIRYVGPDEPLDGGAVLPGLSLRLRDLLTEIEEDDEAAEGTS